MAELILTRKQKDFLVLPCQVIINGQMVGLMRTPQARLHMPAGFYTITIRTGSYIPIGKKGKTIDMTLSSTQAVHITDSGYNCLDFKDSGRWWDVVFTVDLVVWLMSLFLALPHPWNIVYHVLSDGFFIAWLIRLFIVRKRYYAFHSYVSPTPPEEIKPRKSRIEHYMYKGQQRKERHLHHK